MRYPYQTNLHWLDRATNSLTIGRQFCRPNIRLPRTGRDTPRYKGIFQKTKRFQCGSSQGRKQGNEKSLPGDGFGCQKQENLNRLKHPPSNGSISPQDFKLLLADWLLVDFQTKAPSEAHSRFLLKRWQEASSINFGYKFSCHQFKWMDDIGSHPFPPPRMQSSPPRWLHF